MKRLVVSLFGCAVLAALLATSACEGEECCPVSETFTCSNFDFGGARSLQPMGVCQSGYTDNLPSLKGKKVDAKGCTYWEIDPTGPRTCGVARPIDAAADATDAAVDATDAAADATDAALE